MAAFVAGTGRTQDAAANGDTRTLTFLHTHTSETATITFRKDGRYDDEALNQLNWLLRDWRVNEPAKMDPHLFDILWEVYREVGSREPIHVVSAYRSPPTNAMLRHRSKAVSEHSQHMAGKAIDIRLPDVDTARLRAVAMRMQYGGVGYYPSSAFVHIDTGSVRAWPRMSEQQLAQLFPDGKTVHLPPSGKPLARYEEARAEILARDAALASAVSSGPSLGSLLARLFRGPDTGVTESRPDAAPPEQTAALSEKTVVASASPEALMYAPLPPRRPAGLQLLAVGEAPQAPDLVPSAQAVVETAAATGTFEQQGPAADGRSFASRLLFSTAPIRGEEGSRVVVAVARVEPRPLPPAELILDLEVPALDLRLSRQPQREVEVASFTGPAVRPLPVLRPDRS